MTTHAPDKLGDPSLSPPAWSRRMIYVAFFLSGAAALIYEISWSRQIGLLFGHTVQAASVVLASYFAGMAIGYLVGAWTLKIDKVRASPLIGYAIAEIVVAGWAFAIPLLLDYSESATFAPWLSSSSLVWQTTARAMFCFLLLLPATVALGTTLPLMAAFLAERVDENESESDAASRVSLAYALNTAGALVGVLTATFYLLVNVGVSRSSYFAAVLSVLCAVLAWIVQRVTFPRVTRKKIELSSTSPIDLRLVVYSFLSGFGVLALQILYTRMFSLVFHNSTYTFGIVIAVFLGSLSLGAALASRWQARFPVQQMAGIATALGALAVALSVPVFVWLTELHYFRSGDSFLQYVGGAVLLVSAVVAPAITALGMLLPSVWGMAGVTDDAGRVVGRLTSVNTLAAACGAIAASFLLLVYVGLWQSIMLIAALFFFAAMSLLRNQKRQLVLWATGLLLVATVAFSLGGSLETHQDKADAKELLVKRWSSAYGWIDVVQQRPAGAFKIRQNLHYRFGKTGGNAREFRQAHLPLLLHEQPSDVLFLGLGTGLTAGGAVPHEDVDRIVAVELIPEVVEAVRMLSEYNYNVVDDPKVEVAVDDARHFLLAQERKFDVIVSDLFVPWESESGYLYTVEHYGVARQRLKAGGLFCQWLPLYQLGEREFESIANSFASVFPTTTIWWGQMSNSRPIIALIGSESAIQVDATRLETRLERLGVAMGQQDPSIASPSRFWKHYLGDWEVRSTSNLNTDEFPRVEFLTPISNRNGKMLKIETFESYYDRVLSQLDLNAAVIDDSEIQSRVYQRRAGQRFVLFGD